MSEEVGASECPVAKTRGCRELHRVSQRAATHGPWQSPETAPLPVCILRIRAGRPGSERGCAQFTTLLNTGTEAIIVLRKTPRGQASPTEATKQYRDTDRNSSVESLRKRRTLAQPRPVRPTPLLERCRVHDIRRSQSEASPCRHFPTDVQPSPRMRAIDAHTTANRRAVSICCAEN